MGSPDTTRTIVGKLALGRERCGLLKRSSLVELLGPEVAVEERKSFWFESGRKKTVEEW